MAIKRICDVCEKEIKGKGNTVIGYKKTILGSNVIFERDLCDECFEEVRKKTLKK